MMAAVWLRFRVESRTRWRVWLGLALLVGAAAGAVTTLAAGARRTDSAYSRFLDAQNAGDLLIINFPEDGTAVFDFDEIADLPQVADSAVAGYDFDALGVIGGTPALAPVDGRLGSEVNRVKVLEGRLPDPTRPEEVAVGLEVAEQNDLEPGDTFPFVDPEFLPELGTPEFAVLSPLERAEVRKIHNALPNGELTVTGSVAAPGWFPPTYGGLACCVLHTPAFAELGLQGGEALAVRLERGAADGPAFLAELERLSGGEQIQLDEQATDTAAVERSLDVQSVALWLLAGLVAFSALLIVGQLLVRTSFLESTDDSTLAALGMSATQRWLLGVARSLAIGLAGAAIGVGLAVALSPLFPTGLARIAEPDPGFAFDITALALGSVATVVLVAAVGSLAAALAVRTGSARATPSSRPVRVSDALARAGAPSPLVAGLRLTFGRGRGRSAVPVATSLVATTLGVAVLAGALTFGASLNHLLATPRFTG